VPAQDDVNAVVGGFLRELSMAQPSPPQMYGFKRAANAIFSLDTPLTELRQPDGSWPRIHGIGPASTRVIDEVLATGGSPTVEAAIDRAGIRADVERRRRLRRHFLSRAEVRRVLSDPSLTGPSPADYRGDLQMHSLWSDGQPSVAEIAAACDARGYAFAAITDHSHGLRVAGGMSMAEAADQRREIDRVNAARPGACRVLQGIEANITVEGTLDLSAAEAAAFDIVLAAPHSRLRVGDDQTARLLTALAQPAVRVLAHPRGRMSGARAGIVADWDAVFDDAARRGIAVEIDGDPARQDLDHTLAARALAHGCLFALDSDAHTTAQFAYVDTALAHARLAAIPRDVVVNCWELDRLLAWLADPRSERRV
jgi:putative hydrolase